MAKKIIIVISLMFLALALMIVAIATMRPLAMMLSILFVVLLSTTKIHKKKILPISTGFLLLTSMISPIDIRVNLSDGINPTLMENIVGFPVMENTEKINEDEIYLSGCFSHLNDPKWILML